MAVTRTNRPNLGSGSIKFIEGIPFEGIGSAGFDDNDLLIIGDDLDNPDLTGGDGHDEIEGGAGNDILREGLGNGILNGGDGNDDLDGGPGTEKLFGGNGDDILRAGGSAPQPGQTGDYDRLSGGAGNDTFGFYGVGHFEIADLHWVKIVFSLIHRPSESMMWGSWFPISQILFLLRMTMDMSLNLSEALQPLS